MINLTNSEHWLIEKASQTPQKNAISTDSKVLTYEQLLNLTNSTANYLFKHGVRNGENVCLLSEHSHRFWIVVNSLWLLGAVPVLLNTRNTPNEIEWQIRKVESTTLINFTGDNANYSFTRNLTFADFNFTNEEAIQTDLKHSAFSTLNSSLIIFTSGSTGKPKAVVHTFNSLFESVKAAEQAFNLSNKDVWLASLPLYHIGGLMILVRSLLTGSEAAFPKSVKHNHILEAADKFNPTHISFVSTTLKKILDDRVKPNKNLKLVFLGGGPISKDMCEQALKNGFPIVKVYGSSETCSMICALKPDEVKTKPCSSGKVLSDQIKLTDNDGEILVSSPTLFTKYYNDDETTKIKIHDKLYHSGDFGWIDDEGYLFIDSRREDIIISGGENISAKEIESALTQLDNVTDCFVFGLNDNTWGQIVCAAVVSNNNSGEEIKSALDTRLASYKIPKKFFFVKEIPRNEMGKVKRQGLMKSLNLDAV